MAGFLAVAGKRPGLQVLPHDTPPHYCRLLPTVSSTGPPLQLEGHRAQVGSRQEGVGSRSTGLFPGEYVQVFIKEQSSINTQLYTGPTQDWVASRTGKERKRAWGPGCIPFETR